MSSWVCLGTSSTNLASIGGGSLWPLQTSTIVVMCCVGHSPHRRGGSRQEEGRHHRRCRRCFDPPRVRQSIPSTSSRPRDWRSSTNVGCCSLHAGCGPNL